MRARLKRLILIREPAGPDRTFGALHWGTQLLCHTMEPGNNDTGAPRVRPGWYICEPHAWEPGSPLRFKQTWALVGHEVSHQPEPGVPRSAILFHAGNLDEHTRGCILVGLRRGVLRGEPAVLDSVGAMDVLRDLIEHNPFGLSVMGD